jgi:hypothetical protein
VVDSLGVVVDVTAGIDVTKREAFWIFESKDPATGLPPTDPSKGFLPVNDSISQIGEGYVNYTIKPASNTQTSDSVIAVASIVFDVNEAIKTPKIFNTIDALPPSSTLNALVASQDSNEFRLSWRGTDELKGSGVANFDLYVSENSGPFQLYEEGLTDSSTNFIGVDGKTYGFFTLATDNTGNK